MISSCLASVCLQADEIDGHCRRLGMRRRVCLGSSAVDVDVVVFRHKPPTPFLLSSSRVPFSDLFSPASHLTPGDEETLLYFTQWENATATAGTALL